MPYGSTIGNALSRLEYYGLSDVIIPFILIFTILYAILGRVKVFGGEDEGLAKKFNITIALAITLLSIIPHVTGSYRQFDIVEVINTTFPQIALLIATIVMVLILLGVTGSGKTVEDSGIVTIVAALSLIIAGIIFWRAISPGATPQWLGFLDDPNLQATIITIVAFALVVWFITSEPRTNGDSTMDSLAKLFKKSGGGKKGH